jgi:hypothetical protein
MPSDITARAMGARMQNIEFVDIGFIRQTDLIVIGYLSLNSGLPSRSQFIFHGNSTNKSCTRKFMQYLPPTSLTWTIPVATK